MPTPYAEIDNMFLADIRDDTFLIFDEEERTEILNNLRRKAITEFRQCRKNLSDRDDVAEQFGMDLTDEEILIIATGMRKYWLNDKLYDLRLLKQRMSTKDWKMTSQANHLLRLMDLKGVIDKELDAMIVRYTYHEYD